MNDDIKKIRYAPDTERMLRQFLKLETGLGKNEAYHRGHEFAFGFTQAQKDEVNKMMAEGMSFEEAFDVVARRR